MNPNVKIFYIYHTLILSVHLFEAPGGHTDMRPVSLKPVELEVV
jgi:hypothetical protein